jgi:phosphopantetheinyl transferase (holo-ACP synthase)
MTASDLETKLCELWQSFVLGTGANNKRRRTASASARTSDDPIRPDLARALEKNRSRLAAHSPNGRYFAEKQVTPEWESSRSCILDAYENLLKEGVKEEEIGLSLTHCPGLSLAIAWDNDEGSLLAGVDIEKKDRVLSEKIARFFALPSEKDLSLSRLGIWTVKEACYKATEARYDTNLQDYLITSYDDKTGLGKARLHSSSRLTRPFNEREEDLPTFRFISRVLEHHVVSFATSSVKSPPLRS